ncbi:hypothetical protein BC937DRAFT_86185 [Endogone sp. FLAS-F59071]|nr:hypothetical protein BC937DRAFT_86185 [Endogone sp. FLAS-F59071]|eukprot:RUS13187.1 hypothetical protein BC937DRAFT_86185 [Endogone sp. FLAS-F59071]
MAKEVKPGKETTSIEPEELQQGMLYLLQINGVKLALFEGWNDDMCCFNLLREDASPMRWSESRYLPGDFSTYEAFDATGNPSIELWRKALNSEVPRHWFIMFEEARRKQRVWSQGDDDLGPPIDGVPQDSPYAAQPDGAFVPPPLPPTPPTSASVPPPQRSKSWFGSRRRKN